MSRLGKLVRETRQKLGLNQQQLADLCGVSQSIISRIERTGEASEDLCQVLAKNLGIPADILLFEASHLTFANLEPDEYEYISQFRSLNAAAKRLAIMQLDILQKATSNSLLVIGEIEEDGKVVFRNLAAVKISESDTGPLRFGLRSKIKSDWLGLQSGSVLLFEASTKINPKFPSLWETGGKYFLRNFEQGSSVSKLTAPGWSTLQEFVEIPLGFFIKLLQPQ